MSILTEKVGQMMELINQNNPMVVVVVVERGLGWRS